MRTEDGERKEKAEGQRTRAQEGWTLGLDEV